MVLVLFIWKEVVSCHHCLLWLCCTASFGTLCHVCERTLGVGLDSWHIVVSHPKTRSHSADAPNLHAGLVIQLCSPVIVICYMCCWFF